MNALKIAVVLAMMVGIALSGTCDSVCKAPCDVAQTACNAVSGGNALCGMNHQQCSVACDAICACDNTCEAQCMPAFTQCQTDNAANPIALATCDIHFANCAAPCEAQCAVGKVQEAGAQVAQTIGGIVGGK